jgi:lipopolysaccharide/colanic/teichoic acid biosynthesis glycosyltransferase
MYTEPNVNVNGSLKENTGYLHFKRVQDVVLSTVGLIILFPVLVLISLVILIDSPGASPIYVQTRVGLNGKKFRFYKFRTMHPNADKLLESLLAKNEMTGPVFKIKNDPRITRVGKILRKTSLDELPQLWNVLKGDMSMVGPRPALPRETEQYDAHAWERTSVVPGLTCYWQIQPKRNSLSFEKWLELDLKYIEERSFLVDWKIMFGTISAVLHMEGE